MLSPRLCIGWLLAVVSESRASLGPWPQWDSQVPRLTGTWGKVHSLPVSRRRTLRPGEVEFPVRRCSASATPRWPLVPAGGGWALPPPSG